MQGVLRGSRLASKAGGVLNVVDPGTGELLFDLAVPPGLVDAGPYLDAAAGIGVLQIESGLVEIVAKGGFGMISYHPASHDSGANPDYQPPSGAEKLAMQLRAMVDEVRERSDHIERREAALRAIERVPAASAAADPAVIEDDAGQP